MKKIGIYIGVLIAGLLLGWLLFGRSASNTSEEIHDHNAETEQTQMWTCSMHPQIMQPEPGNCPICGMELIPADSKGSGIGPNSFELSANAMALADIQTTVVGNGMLAENQIKLSGKIVENEEANTVQASYFSGRLDKLYVNYKGESVRSGQLLAILYSPQLYAAQQELLTAERLKASQPELYHAVRNKLKLWKLTDAQINAIEKTGEIKENLPVYATVSGTVTEKLVSEGDYIKEGQPLLKIANLNSVWANFDVYENQIGLFDEGQSVTITTAAYPGKSFKGKVDFISPVLDAQTRTVTLRVVLNNSENRFKPGMFVTATVNDVSVKGQTALTIPSSAVLWTGERSVVYVKTDPNEPVFEMREIELGNRIGETYEVLNGLNAGEHIVTQGAFTVDAAAQLQGKKSMMNQESENSKEMDSTSNMKGKRIAVSMDFKNQLESVFEAYIRLKDAMVAGDALKVNNRSKDVLNALNKVDMKLLKKPEAHEVWMPLKKTMTATSERLTKSSDIESQRSYFKRLSNDLLQAVESFGVNEKVYNIFCPMADNNHGAYWLSKEAAIRNPYFGKAMLTCGEVKQIIQ
ncbi:efflux RND transporter periplasmic adaptor subunit [Gaetbulibacter aestuarii]|uniref:Efflux RND transporter periplasmic adaptor subunit n=1 Tax=Gaetbulibacter aestuarii TaxID=1502358 RepID=A0ABW7N3M4_9FLAO